MEGEADARPLELYTLQNPTNAATEGTICILQMRSGVPLEPLEWRFPLILQMWVGMKRLHETALEMAAELEGALVA